jgi:hypothetical protein
MSTHIVDRIRKGNFTLAVQNHKAWSFYTWLSGQTIQTIETKVGNMECYQLYKQISPYL